DQNRVEQTDAGAEGSDVEALQPFPVDMGEDPARSQPEQSHRDSKESKVIEEHDAEEPGKGQLQQQAGKADQGDGENYGAGNRRRHSLGFSGKSGFGHK